MPIEILTDVFGFLPRTDLNNDMFVNKKWHGVIKGGGKRLPQCQELCMHVNEPQNGPISVEFANCEKLVRLLASSHKSEKNIRLLSVFSKSNGKLNQEMKMTMFELLKVHGTPEFSVLKNCIIGEPGFSGRFEDFEKSIGRIVELVGQKLPMKQFNYDFMDHEPEEEIEDLLQFRDNYSSITF